jgi:tRNA 2-thiouridine synthesizing protein A
MSSIQFDLLLDVKGMNCPLPILKMKRAFETMTKGNILKIETTDPNSKSDMASWVKRTGYEILQIEERAGIFIFYIKKTE